MWTELAAIASIKCDLVNEVNLKQEFKVSKSQTPIKQPIEKETKKEPDKKPPVQNVETIGFNSNLVQGDVKSIPKDECNKKDSAQVWMDIVSNIPSLPSRAFYSGVAKLVEIKDKQIVLGFLHDNTLNQAKSQSKISQLLDAIKKICPDYTVDFRKISADTKTIEIKHKPIPRQPDSVSGNQKPINIEAKAEQKEAKNDDAENKIEEIKKERKQYSSEVKQMLDEFNGTIIEE